MNDKNMIWLKIGNEADRVAVASILFKNGYTVTTGRRKKNGKAYEYFVGCVVAAPNEMPGGESYEG